LLQEEYDILVPKAGTVQDLATGLMQRANLPDEILEHLRVYEAHGSKVYKELPMNYAVASINDYTSLYVEKIPDEEIEHNASGMDTRTVQCVHMDKEVNKLHGVPFIFLIKPVSLHYHPLSSSQR